MLSIENRQFVITAVIMIILFLFGLGAVILLAIKSPNDKGVVNYHGGSYSSMVLALPSETVDWKEWHGMTFCFIEGQWHQCYPEVVNSNK